MKTTITKNEHLQLIGLLTLAERHNQRLTDIQEAVNELFGTKDDDHVNEAVWGDQEFQPEQLLERLKIQVEDKG